MAYGQLLRNFAVAALAAALTSPAAFCQAQGGGQTGGGQSGGGQTGGGGSQPGGQPGGGAQPGRTPSPTQPTQQRENVQEMTPEMPRPTFLSGRVMLEDGTPPPEPVMIERVCNGIARPEDYTDSKGRFSIELGRNTRMFADASVGSVGDPFDQGGFGSRSTSSTRGSMGGGPLGQDPRLFGCELRASLPGYRSDVVPLSQRRMLDNPDIGVIILHRLANVEGTTISMTTLQAPKDAKKAFEKGLEANRKQKWADAQKQLEKAVAEYPQYAAAWFELGFALHAQNRLEDARKAYNQSLDADPKFVKPYLQLAVLAQQEKNWKEVAERTDRLVKLNPVDFPQAYVLNSVAQLNLRNLDAAEQSVREAIRLDAGRRMPKAEHILGVILANKGDFTGAAQHVKSYLDMAPQAPDAEPVRKLLIELQQRAGMQPAAPAKP